MESNTPNSGKSPSLNTLPTPNNPSHTPSDVRSVTQTQDSERSFVTLDSAPDHQHMLNAPCAAARDYTLMTKDEFLSEQVHDTPCW